MKSLIILLFCCTFAASACGDDSTTGASEDSDSPGSASSVPDDSVPGQSDGGTDPDPADGAPLGGGPYPVGEVAFIVTDPDGSTTEFSVSCLGDTATVFGDVDTSGDTIGNITGDRMCLALSDPAVSERLINGEPADQVCTEIFGSEHTAEVSGTLDGVPFATSFHRANGCGIDDWDTLMADLLPPV